MPENFSAQTNVDRVDLVIGCVDSRAARRAIAEKVTGRRSSVSYWLDLGNHSTGGQFVLGQPWNWRNKRSATRLRTVAELFPELIDDSLDDDGEASCSAAEALEQQAPFVNPAIANHALALLARLSAMALLRIMARSSIWPVGACSHSQRTRACGEGCVNEGVGGMVARMRWA